MDFGSNLAIFAVEPLDAEGHEIISSRMISGFKKILKQLVFAVYSSVSNQLETLEITRFFSYPSLED